MTLSVLSDVYCSRLSPFIAGAMGLHFPRERWPDLRRGLAGAAQEFGFDDVSACAEWLLSSSLSKARLQVLACHLTIGETYFFRDQATLRALSESVLPELIRSRRGGEQRLRIWSTACCSGEEPYTLAILLHQLLPDLSDWHVTILGTDINPRFLHKAAAGIYGEWSFRDAPTGLKERYFTRAADGRYAVNPEIKALVRFSNLNLVENVYPSPVTDTNAMDLICCRNVLMYFTAPQIEKVIGKLRRALVDGGWLAVSPSEAPQASSCHFTAVNFPGAILHRKRGAAPWMEKQPAPEPSGEMFELVAPASEAPLPWASAPLAEEAPPALSWQNSAPDEVSPGPYAVAESLYQQGLYAEAVDTLLASFARHVPGAPAFSLLVRAQANQGKLAEALVWCERWVGADKVDPLAYYLRAVVLLERGDPEEARASLQRALYLHPDFALGHFVLGNLARSGVRNAEADRHFANALSALRRHQPEDLLPESDGLSAGRMIEIITAMTALENTA